MSEQCLELKNVCKRFHDCTLNNISFTLPQGYIMGLVGPNGAGKTGKLHYGARRDYGRGCGSDLYSSCDQ